MGNVKEQILMLLIISEAHDAIMKHYFTIYYEMSKNQIFLIFPVFSRYKVILEYLY